MKFWRAWGLVVLKILIIAGYEAEAVLQLSAGCRLSGQTRVSDLPLGRECVRRVHEGSFSGAPFLALARLRTAALEKQMLHRFRKDH
jgi:hypothetical protein